MIPRLVLASYLLAVPFLASAQTFRELIENDLVRFVDGSVIPLLYALAFLFFLMGILRFFFSESDEAREQGRQFALWGVVGLFVLFAIWGIVKLFLSVLGI